MKKTGKTKERVIKKFFKMKKNLPIIAIGGLILAFAVYALAAPSAFKGITDNMFGSTMQLRSQNTVTTSHTYDRVEVECASNGFHDLTGPCSNTINEMDRMEEAMEYCTVNGGTDGSVETLHFDIDDRCDYPEFNCTKGEVIDAAEDFEYDSHGFMNWIDEYMDECDFENDHYNGIDVECDDRHYEDYLDHTNTANATCDDYEQWMREAFLYCDENGSYIEDFEFHGYGCNDVVEPIEAINTLRKR